jgi:tripartite-type tricarboxylate transporter receptor subunit TctC
MPDAMRRRLLSAAMLASPLSAVPLAAPRAQEAPYPNRPIRLLLPAGPGSGVDILTRLLADMMTRQTKASFVVENRAGAAGAIGARHAVTQPADGYSLFYGGPNFVILPVMSRAFSQDINIRTAFEPVTIAGSGPFLLVANPRVPAETLEEFIAWLKENPGKWNVASSGVGATVHLLGELFRLRAGIPPGTHVSYRGDGAAVQAVAQGEAHWTIAVSGSTKPFIDAGTVRALATTGPTRMAGLPNVPTMAETGLVPDLVTEAWLGYFAPAGTPPDRIAWLQRALAQAIHEPSLRSRLDDLGFEPVGSPPEALRAVVERDLAMWASVVEQAKVPRD